MRFGWRIAFTATALGLAFTLGTGANSRSPESVPNILPTGLGREVDLEVARARAATSRFRDVKAAIAAGYEPTERCVAHPEHGAMGLHYKKPVLRDGTPDVEHPEILLYARMPDGGIKLTGAEYVVPLAVWKEERPPMILGQPMHRDGNLGIWDLHAWLWEANPSGIFADWNPSLKC
jgi:hypothetical protein